MDCHNINAMTLLLATAILFFERNSVTLIQRRRISPSISIFVKVIW